MLTVLSDQIVIPDKPNKRITVYSLDGTTLRHIPFSLISDTHVCTCSVDETSVIVSDCDSSQVSKVNIATGEVMWTCRDVRDPMGVTCYTHRYVFVAGYNNNTVKILDVSTGKIFILFTYLYYYYINIDIVLQIVSSCRYNISYLADSSVCKSVNVWLLVAVHLWYPLSNNRSHKSLANIIMGTLRLL